MAEEVRVAEEVREEEEEVREEVDVVIEGSFPINMVKVFRAKDNLPP